MKISLIVPTINRVNELDRLLKSIEEQEYSLDSIEVIIVDQNKDNRLDNIVNYYKRKYKIIHKKVNFKGAAKARNFGVKFASGDVVTFPDDDSYYERNTLKDVIRILDDKRLDALSVRVIDPVTRKNALLNFPSSDLERVTCFNFFKTTIEFNLFWRKNIFFSLKGFNERFGVGSDFFSEESAELIIRALKKKYKIYYTSRIRMYHLDKRNPDLDKIYKYSFGLGKLFRLNRNSLCAYPYVLNVLLKSLVGMFVFAGNSYKRKKYYYRIKGFLDGVR